VYTTVQPRHKHDKVAFVDIGQVPHNNGTHMMELLQENGGFTCSIEQDRIHKLIIFGQIDHQHHGVDPWSTEKILVSENESIGYQNDLG
jgi:hypothetical protein